MALSRLFLWAIYFMLHALDNIGVGLQGSKYEMRWQAVFHAGTVGAPERAASLGKAANGLTLVAKRAQALKAGKIGCTICLHNLW